MNQPLFNEYYNTLNIKEALNRMQYWIEHIENPLAIPALKLLINRMQQEADEQ